jgi:hypothetical protein
LKVLNNILDCLDKAEGHTLPFSFLLKSSRLSRHELLHFFNKLEWEGVVSRTIDFWGDPKSYTLLVREDKVSMYDMSCNNSIRKICQVQERGFENIEELLQT